MHKIILDASALIALILEEPGHDIVSEDLAVSLMSTVNASEVLKFLILKHDMQPEKAASYLQQIVPEFVAFDVSQCHITAELSSVTEKAGLSFGDRACLALALETRYQVYTADRAWTKLPLENIDIRLIR